MIDRWSTLRSGAWAGVSLPCTDEPWATEPWPPDSCSGAAAPSAACFSAGIRLLTPADDEDAMSAAPPLHPVMTRPAAMTATSDEMVLRRDPPMIPPMPVGLRARTCGTPPPVPADSRVRSHDSAAEESRARHQVHPFLPACRG